MKQVDFFQINTLVRVREKTLLTDQQKNTLLCAPDLFTAVKLLTEWTFFSFADFFSAEDSLQALLAEEHGWLLWAGEIAPDVGVEEMFMLSSTVHNLKVFLKERLTGKALDKFYLKHSLYQAEDFPSLLDNEKINSKIPLRWKETILQAIEDYQRHPSLARIDVRLDAFYWKELMAASERIKDPDIDAVVAAMVDLYHLSMMLQVRISGNMVPSIAIVRGGLLKDSISRLLEMPSDEQDAFLLNSQYGVIWEKLASSKDTSLFDVYADDYLMMLCKKARLQAFGIFPLYAFLFAKLRDIKNVRLILSGKSLLLSDNEIGKRIGISYEL